MSALNVFLFPDVIHVWTDGALYDADGTLLMSTTKVGPLPHLNAAVMTRGPALALPLLTHCLGVLFSTFDDLVVGLSEAVAQFVTYQGEVLGECSHGTTFEVVVAGWSESRGQPEAYLVRSADLGRVSMLGSEHVSPANDILVERMKGEFPGSTQADLRTIDVARRLMELQREIRVEQVEGQGKICGVGGFCQVTTITPAAIMTGIVRRWPDVVGEKMGSVH